MNITITINADNDAFAGNYTREMERILMDIARRIKREARTPGDSFKVMDINGNTVGKVEVSA